MKALAIILLVTLTASSCGSTASGSAVHRPDGPVGVQAGEVVAVSASSDTPTGTLDLLVAFSDLIIQFTILSEEEGQVFAHGGSSSRDIRRKLTIAVDSVLWSTDAEPAVALPKEGEEFVFQHEGWWDNGEQIFRQVSDGKELVVGNQYYGAFRIQPAAESGIMLANYASLYASDGESPVILGADLIDGFAGTPNAELIEQLSAIAARPEVAVFAGKSEAERQLLPLGQLSSPSD